MRTVQFGSNQDKHGWAAESLLKAIQHIKATIAKEDGLEWDGALRELLENAEFIHKRLVFYSEQPF